MVTLREWRTAGIIQSVRVGAVLQEQWLKDGNSVAYASEAPWLCQDGCGWQDVKDIYSQLSPESWSAIPLNHFLFPPYPPSHAFSCSACGGWHRQKSLSTLGAKWQQNWDLNMRVSSGVWESSWELGTACMELLSDSHTSQNPLMHSFSHGTAGIKCLKDGFYTAEVSFQVVSDNMVGVYLKHNCLHLFSTLQASQLHNTSYFKGLSLALQAHSAKFKIGGGKFFFPC